MAGIVTFAPEEDNSGHVVQVAVGGSHALLLTDEGIVYTWGGTSSNEYGQLGRMVGPGDEQTPSFLYDCFKTDDGKFEVIVQIAAGHSHSLALTQTGRLYAWGNNKAGQLGFDVPHSPQQAKTKFVRTPHLVKGFDGATGHMKADGKPGPPLVVKSCACGPESSSCVTTTGDVYVWGAMSYYIFDNGAKYSRGENCMLPVRIRGVPKLSDDHCADRVSLHRKGLACSISPATIREDLARYAASLKERATMLGGINRYRKASISKIDLGKPELEQEEFKTLNKELREQWKHAKQRIAEIKASMQRNTQELQNVNRMLTICDQQDTAYTENAGMLEVKRGEAQLQQQNAATRQLDTQLNDINHFKKANRQNKMEHLGKRDRLEQEQWHLGQELSSMTQMMQQSDGRVKMLKALQKGDIGKSVDSSVDDAIRIAADKRAELAATDPQTLAGAGKFLGFREVLAISDRSLQDVSSALKEVSAVDGGCDGEVLGEVLEANLKLRRQYNAVVWDKLHKAESLGMERGNEYFLEVYMNQDGQRDGTRSRSKEAPSTGWGLTSLW